MKGAEKIAWIVVALVLVVIFLAIFVPMLLHGGKWGFDTIIKMITGWMTTPEEELLLKAARCAYFRCIEGCDSSRVKISWEDENGEKVSCASKFCNPFKDGEGKVCGDNAKNNPVTIYLEAPVTITEEHWKAFFKDNIIYKPFVTQQPCQPYGLHVGTPTQALVIPKELKCEEKTVDLVKAVESCELPEGDYKVWSGKGAAWDNEDIIICSAGQ